MSKEIFKSEAAARPVLQFGLQLDLFNRPATETISSAPSPNERRAEVPFPIGAKFNSERWFQGIIAAKQPLVFLYGRNPGIVHVRCHASWECGVEHLVRRCWLWRKEAVGALLAAGYHRRGVLRKNTTDALDFAEVYYRPRHKEM